MAIIKPGRASRRPGYSAKVILSLVRKGKVYAQKWPRKRGTPPQEYQRAAIDRWKTGQQAVKYTSPREQSSMREGLGRYLDKNQGVRGSAAIRLRDWFLQNMAGRAWAVDTPDGRRIYSGAVVKDASDFLDGMEPRVGSLLTRTPTGWLPTVQCRPGYYLQSAGSGASTRCCPPASIPGPDQAVGGY